jgi:hypothetical protein
MVHTLPCVAEAVNTPFALMLPHDAAQVTAALAVNCCVWPWPVDAVAGVIVNGDRTVAVVEALWPLPSVAVAVMVQEPGASGAVYIPELALMAPQDEAQVAATLDVNCCWDPSVIVGLNGAIVSVGAAPTVSTTLAVYAVPVEAVAVILQALPCVADAVNNPLAVMLPQDAAQITEEFAVNCCVCPAGVLALEGVITIGELTVATVEAVWPLPSVAVALTVHDEGARGAVNKPVDEMVPQDAVKLAALLAVNCFVAPSVMVGDNGLMLKVVDTGAVIESYPYAVYFTVPDAIASMVQLVPTVPLAVYRPVALMVPHFAVHVTGMFAVNCCVCPCGVFADTGVMMMAETTVTFAVLVPLPLVAVPVTVHVVLG